MDYDLTLLFDEGGTECPPYSYQIVYHYASFYNHLFYQIGFNLQIEKNNKKICLFRKTFRETFLFVKMRDNQSRSGLPNHTNI